MDSKKHTMATHQKSISPDKSSRQTNEATISLTMFSFAFIADGVLITNQTKQTNGESNFVRVFSGQRVGG